MRSATFTKNLENSRFSNFFAGKIDNFLQGILFAGTSAPELFTNIMGTFVTKSDLGIGTIVGSAVFNIFGVICVCGLFSGQKTPLSW